MKANYEKIFLDFTQTYKAGEDYSPRCNSPVIGLNNIKELLLQNNILPIKAFLINSATGNLFFELGKCYSDKYKNEVVQRNALDDAVLKLTRHGECGIQAGGLIWSFLAHGAEEASRAEFPNELHAFVVIPSKSKGQFMVFDPFFKITCSYDQYLKNEKVLKYCQAVLNKPSWKPNREDINFVTYTDEIYKANSIRIQTMVSKLLEFKSLASVSRWIDLLNYSTSINIENYSKTELIGHLRTVFKSALLLDKKYNVETIDELVNISLPLPKTISANPTFFAPSPHAELIKEIKDTTTKVNRGKSVLTLLEEKKYGSALRTACNDKFGFEFVNIILSFKDQIGLDINERPGSKTAMDYAKNNEDKRIEELLVQHGANTSQLSI